MLLTIIREVTFLCVCVKSNIMDTFGMKTVVCGILNLYVNVEANSLPSDDFKYKWRPRTPMQFSTHKAPWLLFIVVSAFAYNAWSHLVNA